MHTSTFNSCTCKIPDDDCKPFQLLLFILSINIRVLSSYSDENGNQKQLLTFPGVETPVYFLIINLSYFPSINTTQKWAPEVIYTTWAAVLYQIYKHEPKASGCISDTSRTLVLYIAYDTPTSKCSCLSTISKIKAILAK